MKSVPDLAAAELEDAIGDGVRRATRAEVSWRDVDRAHFDDVHRLVFRCGVPAAEVDDLTRPCSFARSSEPIIEWAACKWGFDDNLLRAAAVVSSNWRQSATGGVYAGTCPPHLALVDGGGCPHLFGLFAVNYDAEESAHSTWPALRDSTAFNADFMGGFLRLCFEGYVSWLDSPQVRPENGGPYVAGDEWSCLGFAAAGRWQNADANAFTDTVRAAYRDEPWLDEEF